MKVKRPERPIDAADWQRHLNERLRSEFMAGAEEKWRKRTGRLMTAEELERVLRRYPGDVPPGPGYCPNATGAKLPGDFAVTPLQYVD